MLSEHLGYLSDARRLDAFRAAVRPHVTPDTIVADLGCGSAILGLLCLEAGARHVYAIETGPILAVAKESIKRAGYADRVTFIAEHTSMVTLPEPVDLLICDHVGYFGVDYGILAMLEDARRRLLKPGRAIIPRRLRLFACPVRAAEYDRLVARWAESPEPYRWVRELAANTKHSVKLARKALLAEPAVVGTVDFQEDSPELLTFEASFEASHAGEVQGFAVWFDCELTEGVHMTNAPDSDEAIDRPQALFSLQTPQSVVAGERIGFRLQFRHRDNIAAWTVTLPGSGGRQQLSTAFVDIFLAPGARTPQAARAPVLSAEGQRALRILSLCDGSRGVEEIARLVFEESVREIPSREAARVLVDRFVREFRERVPSPS